MKLPPEERNADSTVEPPDFSTLDEPNGIVQTGRTRDQIYTTVLQLNEPATVAEIAERAGPGVDATREYVRWFADLGLVSQTQDQPEQYVVNRAYLHWRRANRLSTEYSEAELVSHLQTVTEDLEQYRAAFGAANPGDIAIHEFADEHGRDVAAVWKDVSAWETAQERRDVLARALEMARQNGGPAESTDAVDDTELEV